MNAEDKIIRARTLLLLDHPFFGTLSLKLKLVEDSSIQSCETDAKNIYYNPDFIDQLSHLQLIGVVAKAILHIALGHIWRIENRDLTDWNIACAYTIYGTLKQNGFILPSEVYVDEKYYELSAEEVYDDIHQEPALPDENQPGGDNSSLDSGQDGQDDTQDAGTGDESENEPDNSQDDSEDGTSEADDSDGSDNSEDDMSDTDVENETEDGEPDNNQDDSEDDSEDGTSEADEANEPANNDPHGNGGIRPDTSLNKEEQQELEQEWKLAVIEAISTCQGDMPGEMMRKILDVVANSDLPWYTLLNDFLQRTARNDYNWNIPSKRYGQNIIMPSLISNELKDMVIAIDSSGSIDEIAFQKFGAEVNEIFAAFQIRIILLYCDSRIRKIEEYATEDLPIIFEAAGGGGTSFRPVFDYIENEGLTPSCLIYFTDLYGKFPEQEPDYPVLWIAINNDKDEAPFGETIRFKKY